MSVTRVLSLVCHNKKSVKIEARDRAFLVRVTQHKARREQWHTFTGHSRSGGVAGSTHTGHLSVGHPSVRLSVRLSGRPRPSIAARIQMMRASVTAIAPRFVRENMTHLHIYECHTHACKYFVCRQPKSCGDFAKTSHTYTHT